MDLSKLLTEQSRPELSDLDLRSTEELVALMAEDQAAALAAVAEASLSITGAIEAIVGRLKGRGRLVYVGAGTAGRLGLLDAAECPPTFRTDRVLGVMAGGPDAFLISRENVEDDAAAGAADMEALAVTENDVVVGLSASGRTPYTLGAVAKAAQANALTIGVSCNPDAELSRHVDHPIEVVVGPEIIAGSTRLKAGTAQKTVLNMLSTISMVRTGKTYGNLMVDLRATNAKLRDRARRITAQATGAEEKDVDMALEQAEGDVKVAVVMLLTGTAPDEARTRLRTHDGNVREAVREEG